MPTDNSFNSLPAEAYPRANAIGGSLVDSLKDLLVLKGIVLESENNKLLTNMDPETFPDVAEALCTLRDVFNL